MVFYIKTKRSKLSVEMKTRKLHCQGERENRIENRIETTLFSRGFVPIAEIVPLDTPPTYSLAA